MREFLIAPSRKRSRMGIKMIKRINDVLAGLPATIAAGVCLLIKLLLQYGFRADVPLYLDPAWIAVVITGIPLLYLAVWRIIYNPGMPETGASALDRLRAEGKAAILVAADSKIVGLVALSDVLRDDAADMVRQLAALHVKTVLLTGDNQKAADYFAKKAGITDVRADLLPGEKVAAIQALKADGASVCMIGDGVNDAPALKTANIGVAMGCMGSDIAVEAADVALTSDDISKIPYLKKLSDATVRTIKCSISLSLVINAFAITFSLMGILNPTTGALWHNVGSCFVVLLAASLYDRKIC